MQAGVPGGGDAEQQQQQQQRVHPLPPDQLGRAVKDLARLEVSASPRWCQVALDALLAAPGGELLARAGRAPIDCLFADLDHVTLSL